MTGVISALMQTVEDVSIGCGAWARVGEAAIGVRKSSSISDPSPLTPLPLSLHLTEIPSPAVPHGSRQDHLHGMHKNPLDHHARAQQGAARAVRTVHTVH